MNSWLNAFTNDSIIDFASDIDDDDFLKKCELFDDDGNNDSDEEELMIDGTGPKRGGGQNSQLVGHSHLLLLV